jgi:hypothetical protein
VNGLMYWHKIFLFLKGFFYIFFGLYMDLGDPDFKMSVMNSNIVSEVSRRFLQSFLGRCGVSTSS